MDRIYGVFLLAMASGFMLYTLYSKGKLSFYLWMLVSIVLYIAGAYLVIFS